MDIGSSFFFFLQTFAILVGVSCNNTIAGKLHIVLDYLFFETNECKGRNERMELINTLPVVRIQRHGSGSYVDLRCEPRAGSKTD